MKNAPVQTTNKSAPEKANNNTAKFAGTDNPRHLRAINALMIRPQRRKHLDSVAGCSNTPELVAELRRRGLSLPCERVPDIDRDGKAIKRGVYHLLNRDRQKMQCWLRFRDSN